MSEGKRPGGLTALAVINIVFAALGFISILSLGAVIAIFSLVEGSPEMTKASQEMKKAFESLGIGPGFLILMMIFSFVSSLLMLISAIGYLKQKKFLGRVLGNVNALLYIAVSTLSAAMLPAAGGGGFNLMFIINILYPVLTLILLNTTFKEDFIN